ncbi:MAG: hypothetical protein PWQ08_1091 [Clostridiales bacterium]|jgi:hypothetical protein|nr:hypothetical protein [Clostridiales bacterium]
MARRKIWEVDIDIIGPISIEEDISFEQEKGYDEEKFYSHISLRDESFGISATLTAYADSIEFAKTVAFVYLGKMLDVLIIDNDLPLMLQEHENQLISKRKFNERRQFKKDELIMAFKVARKLEKEQKVLLKAIGWYSKGKISNNTLDSFLSYWNAIEIVGKEYHTENEKTRKGTRNKIHQCFLEYFGTEDKWELPDDWLKKMYKMRSKIAHGEEEATSQAINDVAKLIPLLAQTARKIIMSIIDTKYPEDIWNLAKQEHWMDLF